MRLIYAFFVVLSIVFRPSVGFAAARDLFEGLWKGTMQCGSSRYNLHFEIKLHYLSSDNYALMDIYELSKPKKVGRVRLKFDSFRDSFTLTQETWLSSPVNARPFMTEIVIERYPPRKKLEKLEGRMDDLNKIVFQPYSPECKQFKVKRTYQNLPAWRNNAFLAGNWSGLASGPKRRHIAEMNIEPAGEKRFTGYIFIGQIHQIDIDIPYNGKHRFKFIGSDKSSIWRPSITAKGTILASGYSRMMYLKVYVTSPRSTMYLVKFEPLAKLGGEYKKNNSSFQKVCGYFSYWFPDILAPDIKNHYPVLLQNYQPDQSGLSALLDKKWFNYIFGRDPSKLSEKEWYHILWMTMDCAKYANTSLKTDGKWFFKPDALKNWKEEAPYRQNGSFSPERRLRTRFTPQQMIKATKSVVESKKVIDSIIKKIKTIVDGPNGLKELNNMVIKSGARLSYAAPQDIDRFMMAVQMRMSTLQAAAACAKEFGLVVCRLPVASGAEKAVTPDDAEYLPLSDTEKKRFQEEIIHPFSGS